MRQVIRASITNSRKRYARRTSVHIERSGYLDRTLYGHRKREQSKPLGLLQDITD